jgi:hypothetical protein
MEIQSAFNSGFQGLQKATDDLNKAASDIVGSQAHDAQVIKENESVKPYQTLTQPDLTQSIVDLKVAEYQAKGSIDVIKTADETLGTLLDVRV